MIKNSHFNDSDDEVGMKVYMAERLELTYEQCLIISGESDNIERTRARRYITAVSHRKLVARTRSTQIYHVVWHEENSGPQGDCNSQHLSCYIKRCTCVQDGRVCTFRCHKLKNILVIRSNSDGRDSTYFADEDLSLLR
jgi:hypothetical protein